MNTLLHYVYCDAGNWKKHHHHIIEGELSQEDIKIIINCLSDGEFFIPDQVGLPDERFEMVTEADHPWFTLYESGFEPTSANPDVAVTAAGLVEKFKACKDRWNATT